VIPSDAESVDTESCTRRGQKDWWCLTLAEGGTDVGTILLVIFVMDYFVNKLGFVFHFK